MQNEKLLWLILLTNKKQSIESLNINKLNELAKTFNYNAEFVILTNNSILPAISKTYTNLNQANAICSIKIYDKDVKINTQIMKALENTTHNKVMVTNAFYCGNFEALTQMLEKSTQDEVDIVHLTKKRLGFYGELTNATKALYNKVVKMFTNGADKFYIRNCVIFNKLILELMQDFPNKSSAIRETTIALGVNTESIVVDNKFKTAPLQVSTFSQLIISIGVCVFSVALFIIMCAVKMDIDTLLWLVVACITTAVAGIIFLNYAILKEKISIDNFSLEKTKLIAPLFEQTFNNVQTASEATLTASNKKAGKGVKAKGTKAKTATITTKSTATQKTAKSKPPASKATAKTKASSSNSKNASGSEKQKAKGVKQTKEGSSKSKSDKTTAKNA